MNTTQRILFIGAESAGKTTICKEMARRTGMPWVAEYGRELYEKLNGELKFEHMEDIGRMQVIKEDVAVVTTREPYVFCDTSPLVTLFYSEAWYGKSSQLLKSLATRQYDYTFFCARDFAYVDDGTRSGVQFGNRQEAFYLERLLDSNIPFSFLSGTIENRILAVNRELNL